MLNFSEWQRPQEEAKEAAEEVLEGEMPLRMYQLMNAHARLSAADRERSPGNSRNSSSFPRGYRSSWKTTIS